MGTPTCSKGAVQRSEVTRVRPGGSEGRRTWAPRSEPEASGAPRNWGRSLHSEMTRLHRAVSSALGAGRRHNRLAARHPPKDIYDA